MVRAPQPKLRRTKEPVRASTLEPKCQRGGIICLLPCSGGVGHTIPRV